MTFSDEEIAVVKGKYPELERSAPGAIEGTLNMEAIYDGVTIVDSFNIRITAANPHSDHVPALYEIGGRTQSIATKLGIVDLRDLHRNVNGTTCVCVKQVEKEKFPLGSPLSVFIENLVVPYLYGLASFEKNRRWPWGDFSHGSLGLLEFYAENTEPQKLENIALIVPSLRRESNWKEYHKQLRKPNGEKSCLCNSGKPFRKCHERAWRGLEWLHGELLRLGIDPKSLFNQT